MNGRKAATKIALSSFLRSINVQFDADAAERIAHYQPTAKSVRTLSALIEGSSANTATMVTAPYGTGKSLLAAYLLHTVENRRESRVVLKEVVGRMRKIDFGLASSLETRLKRGDSGLVLAIHGAQESLGNALRDAAVSSLRRLGVKKGVRSLAHGRSQDDATACLKRIQDVADQNSLDRVVILWDEFGRHLETLIAAGRSAELHEIQVLAELCPRSAGAPTNLTLFLHKSVLSYASALPDGVRREWAKIEGRFNRLDYVDDSVELLELVAGLMAGSRRSSGPRGSSDSREKKWKEQLVGALSTAGVVREVDKERLIEIFDRAAPMEPVALFVLPRLTTRIAQNERTIFEFVQSYRDAPQIGPMQVFEYFEPAMRTDLAPGGSHRMWLETKSSLAKAENDAESHCIVTIALLTLATAGSSTKVTRAFAEVACAGSISKARAKSAIQDLIKRKICLHRRHSGELSLWHGSDVDLRKKLMALTGTLRSTFDLARFLGENSPPPTWRPIEFNDKYRMRRYFLSVYEGVDSSQTNLEIDGPSIPAGADGLVTYVMCMDDDELEKARSRALDDIHRRRIWVIPSAGVPIAERSLEVFALMEMQRDPDLLSSDPLVGQELRHMEDDARAHLTDLLDRITTPGKDATWIHQRSSRAFSSPREFRTYLSGVCEDVFSDTPIIDSEVINRNKPAAVVVNARKKLLARVLEGVGQPRLGFDNPDIQYEMSAIVTTMYRATFERTGLYAVREGSWCFAAPSGKDNPGLRKVWERIMDFLQESSSRRSAVQIVEELRLPPYGVRPGVLPLLIGAAYVAYGKAVLYCDGQYVADVRPSQIEDLCARPDRYEVASYEMTRSEEDWIRTLGELLHGAGGQSGAFPRCVEALERWKASLGKSGMRSTRLSDDAQRLRSLLLRESDPIVLFRDSLPKFLGRRGSDKRAKLMGKLLAEINEIPSAYLKEAGEAILSTIGINGTRKIGDAMEEWASCFPKEFVDTLQDPRGLSLLSVAHREFATDDALVNSLATVVHKSVGSWTDSDVSTFRHELQTMVSNLENQLVNEASHLSGGSAPILEKRLRRLVDQYRDAVGPERTKEQLDQIFAN